MMVRLGRPDRSLPTLLARFRRQEPTYRGGLAEVPEGFERVHESITVPEQPGAFARGGDALLSWQVHRGAGLAVGATAAEAEPGAVVAQGVRLGPATLWVGCQVVDAERGDSRQGFAYATLPGHPEQGVEGFRLEREPGGLRFTVEGVTRPASLAMRLSGPIGTAVQHRLIGRYLQTMRRILTAG